MIATILKILKPPPKQTVSEWADANRKLSPEASAEPGSWSTSRTEYLRAVMDALNAPDAREIVLMWASQLGKTEALNNLIGYHIDRDPAPILILQPTLDMSHAWSKDRLAPMLRDTPCLRGKVKDTGGRMDSGNTILHKIFPGGHITIATANSAPSLASRPIRIVLCDEVDRYAPSAGAEGDPVTLAAKRSMTFWNRKLVMTSTPTIKDASRIEAAFEATDQRRFFVPCPRCDHRQVLKWANVRWEKDEDGRSLASTGLYHCERCEAGWTNVERLAAVMKGEWRATARATGAIGFHISALYSPWITIADLVAEFLKAKDFPDRLRVFVNTVLGESFEDFGKRIDEIPFMDRREDYAGKVPRGVSVIVAGVDVQDQRLELEIAGFGRGEECWSLDYRIIPGDPSTGTPWKALDDLLTRPWIREDGQGLIVGAAAVDTGGHHTQSAYAYCRERYGRRVWAIKGSNERGSPIWPRTPSRNNAGRVPLFLVGVHAAKDLAAARLRIETSGPGFCHFPLDRDEAYFAQLASEKVVTRFHRGVPIREWRKIKDSIRNEAWDCRVYVYAALAGLVAAGLDLDREADRLEANAHAIEIGTAPPPGSAAPVVAHVRRVRSRGIEL